MIGIMIFNTSTSVYFCMAVTFNQNFNEIFNSSYPVTIS